MLRLALCAILVAACAAPAPKPTPSSDAPRGLRLPGGARPTRYDLELTVDPAATRVPGRIAIDVALDAPTDVIWLNARGLTIGAARVGGQAARAELVGEDFLAVRGAWPAGPARVELEFTAPISHTDSLGVFAQKTDDRWYAYTQLESVYARRVFPCFDEPAQKVPWRLTLVTPADVVAVANTPVESTTVEGARKRWRFAETPPLPSYLVAFAVGPFEKVEAGASAGGVPIALYVPAGHAGEAGYAAEVTAPILNLLERYFGTPHPYPKLDQVAIPQSFGFSAMENPGLVTYAEDLLLSPPAERTLVSERDYAETAIHELAHQWFGNLVTPRWWEDIWLNEALATWSESRFASELHPEWASRVTEVAHKDGAMRLDALGSARRVREPVEDEHALGNIFDYITYGKGAAVLRAVELWLGEDVFRRGIQAYLAAHAHGSASFDDLAAALSTASGQDVGAALRGFFDQAGVPRLEMKLSCGPARLALRQDRYVPLGGHAKPEGRWVLPVCVRWEEGGKSGRACTLLTETTGELALDGASCPTLVVPGDAGMGYFRPAPDEQIVRGLIAAAPRLSAPERLALVNDVGALLDTGAIELDVWMGLYTSLVADPDRRVRETVLYGLLGLDGAASEAERAVLASRLRAFYGPAVKQLGFVPRAGESEDEQLWRVDVLDAVGGVGGDAELRAQALELAGRWLDDKRAVAPDLVDTVLILAARTGDAGLHAKLVAGVRSRKDLQDRQILWAALGAFRDAKLAAASRELVLDESLPLSESWQIVRSQAGHRETRADALAFVMEHHDALFRRLPEDWRPGLGNRWDGLCTVADRDRVRAFFEKRMESAVGGPRELAQSLEQFDTCIAWRARHAAGLAKALAR